MKPTALFVMGSVAILIIGAITRVAAELLLPKRLPVETPTVAMERLNYLLFGTTIFMAFAAIYYWLTKPGDELVDERLGKVSFWLMFVGFNLAILPTSIRRGAPPLLLEPVRLWDSASIAAQMGVFAFGAGTLMTVWIVIFARRGFRA